MDFIFVAVGLAVLFVAGEATLRGAIGMARGLGVSPAMIGLTVVGFGTSAPELMVSVQAALLGEAPLAIGNVVGSNISNLLLILGVGAAIYPLTCDMRSVKRDAGMMIVTAALLVILSQTGSITRLEGGLMVAVLIAFLTISYRRDQKNQREAEIHEKEMEEVGEVPRKPLVIVALTVLGIAGLVGGAHLLVEGAVGIATALGVPSSVIGLTLVALGTSLPELAATIVAALRNHTDVAIANIMGSCVFNVLSILGITSIVRPLVFSPDIQRIDVWVMLAASVAVTVLLARRCAIGRAGGMVLTAAYVAYIASMADRLGPPPGLG